MSRRGNAGYMTEHTARPPDGWVEASETLPGAEQTYVYRVGDSDRVLAGLVPPVKTTDKIRLEVSSIEETVTVHRHDFAVATYDRKEDGVEGLTLFMELVPETLPSDHGEDERLFVAIERCIEAFDTTTDTWCSYFTG